MSTIGDVASQEGFDWTIHVTVRYFNGYSMTRDFHSNDAPTHITHLTLHIPPCRVDNEVEPMYSYSLDMDCVQITGLLRMKSRPCYMNELLYGAQKRPQPS